MMWTITSWHTYKPERLKTFSTVKRDIGSVSSNQTTICISKSSNFSTYLEVHMGAIPSNVSPSWYYFKAMLSSRFRRSKVSTYLTLMLVFNSADGILQPIHSTVLNRRLIFLKGCLWHINERLL